MLAAEKVAAKRRAEALGPLDRFPLSLLLPLIRQINLRIDLILNNNTIIEMIESISELCQGIPPDMDCEDYQKWELWRMAIRPGQGSVSVGYIFEQAGGRQVLTSVVGSRLQGHAIQVVHRIVDPEGDRHSLQPARGWWTSSGGFTPNDGDEVLGTEDLLRIYARDAASAKKQFEDVLREHKAKRASS